MDAQESFLEQFEDVSEVVEDVFWTQNSQETIQNVGCFKNIESMSKKEAQKKLYDIMKQNK